MRVHVLGNILNWGMGFAGLLRAAGHDVRVFVNRLDNAFYQPSWEIPDFSPERYPFVEFVDLEPWRLLAPDSRHREFLARAADCDIIQTFGEYSMWAARTGRPYVVLSYGFDLEFMPFTGWGPRALIRRLVLRKAYRRAAAFVYAYLPHQKFVDKLGLGNAVFEPCVVPIDTRRYAPFPEEERRSLRSSWGQRWVFFHGARQEWYGRARSGFNCKSNDWLFRAFARFVKDEPDSLLIAVRKGKDVARTETLISELGIEGKVQWVPQMTKDGIIKTLNSVDAFCDQFSTGYHGVATLEALSCGVPVFINLEPGFFGDIPIPPIERCGTVDEIHAALRSFARDPQAARARGLAGRDWVVKFHSWEAIASRFGELYMRCLDTAAEVSY